MNNAQIINDLIMKCAEYKKDAEYLAGERDYWKQQAQRNDSVSHGCDTDSRAKLEEDLFEIVRNILNDGALCEADPTGNYSRKPKWEPDESIVNAWVKVLIPRLDRQAAITERELCAKCEWPSLAAMPDLEQQQRIAEQDRSIVEYAEKVDELEAELNRTCSLAYDGKWLTCSECGESLQWFGVRTVYKGDTQERALGVDGVRFCPFCGARIEGGDGE